MLQSIGLQPLLFAFKFFMTASFGNFPVPYMFRSSIKFIVESAENYHAFEIRICFAAGQRSSPLTLITTKNAFVFSLLANIVVS
jgi:hypothetical protein